MKKVYKHLFLGGMLLASVSAGAQVNVSAAIDSTSILIGEQTRIHLEATQNAGQTVQFPILNDTIVKGIEILDISKPDTVRLSDNRFTVKQDILVTSFDSALYYMPPFRFVAGSDTLLTDPLALKVTTFDVDTESKEYFDIKPIKKAPFVLMDYIWLIVGGVLLILAIILGIWLYKRWKYRKDHPMEIAGIEPELPPFEAAIKALDHLKEQKLWQQGLEKEYYTSLTDILRGYIDGRFHVNAMEMTSSEIIAAMRKEDAPKELIDKLKQVLDLADFVKFAKLRPGYEENEMSLHAAYTFVNGTQEVKPEVTDENKEETES